MKYTITQSEYDPIYELMFQALNAPNKSEAKRYIQEIRSKGYGLGGGAGNVLMELCASIENASGRVFDKEKKEHFCKTDYYKLQRFIEESE